MAQIPNNPPASDIAIVGVSCRFSDDATSPQKFWEMICDGRSGNSQTTRFNPDGFSDLGSRKHNQTVTTHGNFLQQDIGSFDAGFFDITPEEASAMDPQQRLMLEVAYEAFENAGMAFHQLNGSKTGCFIGNFTSDYREMIFRDPDAGPRYAVTGTATSLLANRVSWFFDLKGPSITVNTACSSSLVALHLARRSVQSGETDIAIVGGSNLMLGPEMFTFFSNLNFLSRDGLSKSFDASGDGYGRGEGVAAIILKRVDDAVRDRDIIRAVVRGTATNQDGKTKSITLPSLDAQVDLIESAYNASGLNFNDTTYFEAHGTGTRRGDPVELEAISKTLCRNRPKSSKLFVGSVKSNVGHTEATAGLAGIIKAIFMLEEGSIPATIHYNTPLPGFDFDSSNMAIPVKAMSWPSTELRRISINSFGFGGSNAHAVLDDAQSYLASKGIQGAHTRTRRHDLPNGNAERISGKIGERASPSPRKELSFAFSAPDQSSLERNLDIVVQYLQKKSFNSIQSESSFLGDLSYTLGQRRSIFKLKASFIANSVNALISNIQERQIKPEKNHLRSETNSSTKESGAGDQSILCLLPDLPSYSWDHSRSYWAESRVSKEFRLRQTPERSLIGAPQPIYGANEHVWRGHLRLSDEPWVQDHQVLGSIVYPAAGYIAMAVEAARSIADKGREISRFSLRDLNFHSAAIIKEDTPLEWVIQLRPHRIGQRDMSSYWFEFVISTCNNGKHINENCFGLLSIEYEHTSDSFSTIEQSFEEQNIKEEFQRIQKSCVLDQSPAVLYDELAALGLGYGPAFQQISSIKKSPGSSCCTLDIYRPENAPHDDFSHIIHPTTLDCMIQTIFPAIGHSGRMKNAMIPTLIEEMWISAQIPTSPGRSFGGYSTSGYVGASEIVANFAMLDCKTLNTAVVTKGLHCATISRSAKLPANSDEIEAPKICSRLVWIPAMDLLPPYMQLHVAGHLSSTHKLVKLIESLTYARTNLSVLDLSPHSQETALTRISLLPDGLISSSALNYTFAYNSERILDNMANESPTDRKKIRFEKLDLESSLDSQKFAGRVFDVVILPTSISETTIKSIWKNIQQLLNSNGRICVLGELDPAIDTENLSREIESQGFNVDIIEHDTRISQEDNFLLIASVEPENQKVTLDQDILILEGHHSCALALSDALMSLETERVSYIPIPRKFLQSSLRDLQGKTCISTLEMGGAFLENATTEEFAAFKEIVRRCSSVVWFSSSDEPTGSIVAGLARTMRNENASLRFCVIQISANDLHNPENLAEIASRLALSPSPDSEFKLDGGVLKVSRIIRDVQMDDSVSLMVHEGSAKIRSLTLDEVRKPQKLVIPSHGMLDDIHFEADEVVDQPLSDDEVEIQVKASGINFRDVLVMMGSLSDVSIGYEASGVISRIGSKVTSLRKGDRVCTIGHGCHRSFYRTQANLVQKVPTIMSFEEAATIPLVYCTAYHAIIGIAQARKGQTILIHAAAGGVGQAAIQIAKYLGLEIFTTVGSDSKRQLLQKVYGIKADHIFYSRDSSFAKGLMRVTSGRGVDILLNSLAGEQLRQSWHCLAPFGTFVEIGVKDIIGNTSLEMGPFARDATFASLVILNILHQDPHRMGKIMKEVFQLLHSRSVEAVTPVKSQPISQISEALRLLQSGKHMGKLALTWDRELSIPIAVKAARPTLAGNATYVLVGGFGGLGQSIAMMLANRGARNLCILSRSGTKSSEALELVYKLGNQGVHVQSFACDVSDEESLKRAIKECMDTMPPIRGVIQGAMVLRDVSFEKMTSNQWHDTLRPKVAGSWNLHTLLPEDVDFFIILSSFMGVFGSRTQGNYAAAGAYQDSLAHYRRSKGLKAVSLDLGLMRDVSAFSKKEALSGPFKDWQKPFGLREVDVHGLLDHIIASEMTTPSTIPAQILTGLGTKNEAREAEIDPPYYLDDPRFALLDSSIAASEKESASRKDNEDTPSKREDTGARLRQTSSLKDATELIMTSLLVKVSKHLGFETEDTVINPDLSLHSQGVDSLVAIEIKNWIMKEFAADMSLLDITAEEPVSDFAQGIAEKSAFVAVAT